MQCAHLSAWVVAEESLLEDLEEYEVDKEVLAKFRSEYSLQPAQPQPKAGGEDRAIDATADSIRAEYVKLLRPFVHALRCLEEVRLSVLLPLKMDTFAPILRKMGIEYRGLSEPTLDITLHYRDAEYMGAGAADAGVLRDESGAVFGKHWMTFHRKYLLSRSEALATPSRASDWLLLAPVVQWLRDWHLSDTDESGEDDDWFGINSFLEGVHRAGNYISHDQWFAANEHWYTPAFKRVIYDLYMQGWIRSEKDDDTTFVESRLKLANWQHSVQKNTYYNDFVWWVLWPWRRFESRQSPFMYVLPAAQLA